MSLDHAGAARERPPTRAVHLESWGPTEFLRRIEEAMAIYASAMRYPSSAGPQRAITARRHAHNVGFAARAAVDERGSLLGFGYGYTTARGQWWHDLVRRAIGDEALREAWLADGFELSELHVSPDWQGYGIGRRLLLELSASLPHQTILLSTPDADTRAFRLYRRLGFLDLARHYHFPGDARPFAVLGSRLPLPNDG